MKILMLGWELPPHNSGGLGVACMQLGRSLAQKGAQITFVVPYEAKHEIDFMDVISARVAHVSAITGVYDSVTYKEEMPPELAGSVFDIQHRYSQAIEKLVNRIDFNVIHAHDWLTFRAAMRAKELSGKPLVLHVHSVESDRAGGKSGHPLVHEIEYHGLMMADRIFAVSELTKQKIIAEYQIPADKIQVAHNSLELDDMQPLDPHNSYEMLSQLKSRGYKVVANIGRMTIQKGLYNFLTAAQQVVKKRPKTIFLLVGSGDQRHELIEHAASLGIAQNVIFVDFQRGKRWRDAYAIADLFVMPSVSEPFGLTPLEALFYDTPSLISYQSGIAEILKNCLKVDFWDTQKMAEYMIAYTSYESLGETLLNTGRDELRSLSWDNTAHALMSSYREHHAGSAS